MDGVLLAGGLASRLGPITKVTNKHLLPIYDKPLIFYGIETLRDLGCERVIIILGGNSVGDIVNLVRDGSQFGVEIVYKFQHEPKGISDAIRLVRDITWMFPFIVLLGDNIFADVELIKPSILKWRAATIPKKLTNISSSSYVGDWRPPFSIFLTPSDHPNDYGQPLFGWGNKIEKFVEKDKSASHNKIVTGLYGFTQDVFGIIDNQKPSKRGEFEITDTLTGWLPNVLSFNYEGFWSDCGTPEGLLEASQYMKERDKA